MTPGALAPLPPIEARTPRLHLRPLAQADRAEYVRVHQQGADHMRPWHPLPEPGLTPDQRFERALERSHAGIISGHDCRLAAFLHDDGRLAGLFNLNNIVRGPFQCAFAGWTVSADCLRRGIGTEGVRALLGVAFAPWPTGLALHRVQANVMPGNAASRALARRCGFREEGIARAYLEIAGRWEDHVMFAMLADEFAAHTANHPRA